MKISVRKANYDDAGLVALLGRITTKNTFDYLFLNHQADFENYLNDSFSVANIQKWMKDEHYIFWLAFANDLPVGYAKLRLNHPFDEDDSNYISQLDKIYIHQDFIKYKIGWPLYQTIESYAKAKGMKRLWLSVLNENLHAIRFYNKTKFQFKKDFKHAIGEQTFTFNIMVKAL